MSSDVPGEEEASMLKKLTVVTTSKGKDMMEDINNYRYTFNSATMVLRPSIGPGMPAWGSSATSGGLSKDLLTRNQRQSGCWCQMLGDRT